MLGPRASCSAVRSPLDAELMVSELLGTWWGQRTTRPGGREVRRRRADVEELVGEGLVAYAAQQGSPAALALLSGIACLGTPRQAASAEEAALALMERGVARPGWAEHVGAVVAAECYLNSDAYGDRDEVVCVFSYAGQEQHALVVVVDYNAGGLARDGWVTSQVAKLLDYCGQAESDSHRSRRRRPAGCWSRRSRSPSGPPTRRSAARSRPTTRSSGPGCARCRPPCLAELPRAASRSPPSIRAAPAAARARHSSGRGGRPGARTAGPCSWPSSWPPTRPRTCPTARRRAAAPTTSSSYGCDQDFGRPLRMSPAKAETFLLDWLPRKVMLSPAEQHAMPHVLAGLGALDRVREGRDTKVIGATLDAVFDSMGTFTRVYQDPASFGLEQRLVARLLPDSDLEALPRRVFAFGGRCRAATTAPTWRSLDPARPARPAHPAGGGPRRPGGPAAGEGHIDRHLALADRLWRGDPPELWEAAQRLLDLGEDRHAVLHTLMETIRSAGSDEKRDRRRAVRPAPGGAAGRGDRPRRAGPRHRPERRPRRELRRLAARRRRGPADVVTSANIACGFHAGDPLTIRRACAGAVASGVAIGAQVCYRDLAGFGRREMVVPPEELTAEVLYQIAALDGIARAEGGRVGYVKPHGALYNRAVRDPVQAAAVAAAISAYDPGLPLLTLPGGEAVRGRGGRRA